MAWMNRTATVLIRRKTKSELEKAIQEMETRGYEIYSEPKPVEYYAWVCKMKLKDDPNDSSAF